MPYHRLFHILLFTFTFLHLICSPTTRAEYDGPLKYNASSIQNKLLEKNTKDIFSPGKILTLSFERDDCSVHIAAVHERFSHTAAEHFATLSRITTIRLIL